MTTRLSNLGSILGTFAVLMFFGWLFKHDFAFTNQLLHPYLLAIGAAAIGYGLIEALFATVIAVGLYSLSLRMLGETGPLVGSGKEHIYILFSFVLTAVVLGMVQNSRMRQLASTRSELEDVRNEGERLRQRLQVVNTANQKLNERILGEVTTVQSFADIARRLSVLEEKDLYPAICDLVGDFAHAEECSIYMVNSDRLVLMAERGWKEVAPEARALEHGSDLLWSSVDQRRLLTPLDLDKTMLVSGRDPSRRHSRLIAAPILHPQTGAVTGVISVEKIPFAHLHGNTLSMLGVISKWAGDSLHNANSFGQLARELTVDDLMPGCVPAMIARDRYDQAAGSVSLVAIQLQGLRALDHVDQVWFRKTLYGVLQPYLRDKVTLGQVREDSYVLVVLASAGADLGRLVEGVMANVKEKMAGHPQASRLSAFVGAAEGGNFETAWQAALKQAQRC